MCSAMSCALPLPLPKFTKTKRIDCILNLNTTYKQLANKTFNSIINYNYVLSKYPFYLPTYALD